MHEYSVVQALVGRVAEEARERGATVVQRVRVSLGELSGVDPALLASAYDAFRSTTAVCADASLEVEMVPAHWVCRVCGKPIESGAPLQCGACGASARMVSGGEIRIDVVEVP